MNGTFLLQIKRSVNVNIRVHDCGFFSPSGSHERASPSLTQGSLGCIPNFINPFLAAHSQFPFDEDEVHSEL